MRKLKVVTMAAFLGLGFAGCNNHEAEIKSLSSRGDSLEAALNTRDASINEFIVAFNEVEKNLSDVSKKQNVITQKMDGQQGELKTNVKDRINQEIADINTLMESNREKIADLNRRLKKSNGKATQFESMIKTLNDQIIQKDAELVALNDKLTSMNDQIVQLNTSIDTLNSVNTAQAKDITDKTLALHTAYYVVGEKKELQEEKVIDRTGGVLGIGKTEKLSQDIDNSRFTQIDYTKITSIPINSDEPEIVTSHPSSSFTIQKTSDDKAVLLISDPEKFWSASKYLVVVAK